MCLAAVLLLRVCGRLCAKGPALGVVQSGRCQLPPYAVQASLAQPGASATHLAWCVETSKALWNETGAMLVHVLRPSKISLVNCSLVERQCCGSVPGTSGAAASAGCRASTCRQGFVSATRWRCMHAAMHAGNRSCLKLQGGHHHGLRPIAVVHVGLWDLPTEWDQAGF